LIERRWRAVEADIQHFYGVDARTLGGRRLLALIEGLPVGARSTGGGGWFMEQELLASLLEVTVRAHSKKKKGGQPFRVTRPESEPGPKRSAKAKMTDLARQLKGR
jgi:hypothetical protein